MGFISADVGQLAALVGVLGAAPRVAAERSAVAVRKTAFDIEGDGKQLSAVDTGTNRNSISTTVSGGGLKTSAEIGPTTDYGIYLELGTSKMAAQPFMGPAFDRRLPGFLAAIGLAGEALL